MHIASPFQIPLRLHWSVPLLALPALGYGGLMAGPMGALMVLVTLSMLALFVALHELGHALAARSFGISTEHITLFPFGGVAAIERMPEEPTQELVIALAGPAVNLVLVAVAGWSYLFFGGQVLWLAVVINLGMGLFNLIPAFPMDGGRVLRALLSYRMGWMAASRLSIRLGKGFAWMFMIYGAISWWPSLVMVGLFLLFALRVEHSRMVWINYQRTTGRAPPWDAAPHYALRRRVRPR